MISSILFFSSQLIQMFMEKFYISTIVLLICPFTISCWIITPEKCYPGCVRIYQWPSGFASLHIPKYTVQIIIESWQSKGVYDVHVACPAFASTTLINPKTFRRIDMADCLLNDGGIINPGQVITFEYSNILPYPFNVVNLKCV
ncbi:hypothetical protein ACS0TY_024939 [Phlomoides rotata]